MLRQFSGATIRRVVDRSDTRVAEHAHDWPVLSIFLLGDYLNETELGETLIAGPSAIFYQAGAAHRNAVGSVGFEQIEIEFDAAWLGCALMPTPPVSRWLGGRTGAEARRLARFCLLETDEQRLRDALRRFMQGANSQPESAARALRESDHSYAYIAQEAGFCDQSHMNRTFRRLLGRVPSEVRDDRAAFRALEN